MKFYSTVIKDEWNFPSHFSFYRIGFFLYLSFFYICFIILLFPSFTSFTWHFCNTNFHFHFQAYFVTIFFTFNLNFWNFQFYFRCFSRRQKFKFKIISVHKHNWIAMINIMRIFFLKYAWLIFIFIMLCMNIFNTLILLWFRYVQFASKKKNKKVCS